MGPILHATMHQEAQRRRRAAKEKKKMINLNGQPKSEEEVFKSQMAFVLMAKEAEKEAAAKKAQAEAAKAAAGDAGPGPSAAKPFPPDAFEKLDRSPRVQRHASQRHPEAEHHKPAKQPGPGLLLKLAHWLNLK